MVGTPAYPVHRRNTNVSWYFSGPGWVAEHGPSTLPGPHFALFGCQLRRRPPKVRQIKAGVMCLLDRSPERRKSETANHILLPEAACDRIASAVTCQGVIDVFVSRKLVTRKFPHSPS